jgi:GMP synthase-like glutamine amidotransferase
VRIWWVVQHVPYEAPGLIADVIAARGDELRLWPTWAGNAPGIADWRAQAPDALVVMGGPMSAGDDSEYPHLATERELLRLSLAEDVPLLGICLGAQLLAAATGADVYRGPTDELGPGTVTLTEQGSNDPVLAAAESAEVPVMHWHHDTFDLPDGAIHLARSSQYENQAFRIGTNAYGLQFHVEASPDWADAVGPQLPDGISLSAGDVERIAGPGRRILDAFAQLVRPQPR